MASIQGMAQRQAQQRDSLIVQLLKLLLGHWGGFNKWDDVDIVAGWAARSATLVDSANLNSRLLTRSFQTSVLRQMGAGRQPLPSMVNAYPRSNVAASEVYRRPVEQFIWARRNGLDLLGSDEAFKNRLVTLATQDVKLADRDEAQRIFDADPEVTHWRRVIHPELSASGTCGLCIVASQRVYGTGDLMPMHGPSCNCTPMGITKSNDPGLRINDDDLKTIYAAAGSTAAEDLQNTRISIDEHGELGPVLVKHGDHFRTAEEAGRPAYEKPTPVTIRRDRENERADLTLSLDDATSRYAAAAAAGTAPADQVALFRSMKYMRERITSIDVFLSKLSA